MIYIKYSRDLTGKYIDLAMRKLSAHWVRILLTVDQKHARWALLCTNWDLLEADPSYL